MSTFDFEAIRRTVIVAMFSDDVLYGQLVVKGGNALRLVHGMGSRVSLDVDFSTDVDLDEGDTARRIHRALDDRFESLNLRVFDFQFARRPVVVQDPRFSGFQATFKLLPTARLAILKRDLVQAQREALVIGETTSSASRPKSSSSTCREYGSTRRR